MKLKKRHTLFLTTCLLLAPVSSLTVFAEEEPTSPSVEFIGDGLPTQQDNKTSEVIATGTFGTAPWKLTVDGRLEISSGTFSATRDVNPWSDYQHSIKEIQLNGEIIVDADASSLFANLPNLATLKHSEFLNVSQTKNFAKMFAGNKSLTELDLSQWDTRSAIDARDLFTQCQSLTTIKLGSNTLFHQAQLSPDQAIDTRILWQSSIDKINYPSLNELLNNYDGTKPDTYNKIAQTATGQVTIFYQDVQGNSLHEPVTVEGRIGEPYDFNTPTYKLTIPGYQLIEDKLPPEIAGVFSENEKNMIFRYQKKETNPSAFPAINYQAHVEKIGWQTPVTNGQISGTTGQGKQIEALRITSNDAELAKDLRYQTHIENIGWQAAVSANQISGTTGKNKQVEALKINLAGNSQSKYDIYYRAHVQNLGWLDWTKNGAAAGSSGFGYQVEAIQIKLVPKNAPAPGKTARPYIQPTKISYQTHVSNIGWQNYVNNGATSGTTGQSRRLEAIRINAGDSQLASAIRYQVHVQDIGWQTAVGNNQLAGTVGRAKRLEAIKISLSEPAASLYDVYYRTHSQRFGWLDWAKNGAASGTAGYAYRLEAIQIKVVPKGAKAPGKTTTPFKELIKKNTILNNVPYVSQYVPINTPWGCAGASMTMLLRSKNIPVDLKYVQDHLPMYPADPNGQKGNVYTGKDFGWVINPTGLTNYMRRWSKDVQNISGSSTNEIISHISNGRPVLYYGYSSYQKDTIRNHCKVIAGYKNNQFLVYDPLYKSPNDGPYTAGHHPIYDRGAKHWVSVNDFNKEYNGLAITIY